MGRDLCCLPIVQVFNEIQTESLSWSEENGRWKVNGNDAVLKSNPHGFTSTVNNPYAVGKLLLKG